MDENVFGQFRKRFPIFESKVYLNSCSQGALSVDVEAALRSYLDCWNEQGSPWEHWIGVQEELRREFAGLIGAQPEEVAVTFSASTAIYAVASALQYRPRNRVVLGELEFPTQCHVWLAQEARGATIDWVSAPEGRLSPADYGPHLDAATAIVPVSHVGFRNGFRVNVAELAGAAQACGAYILLDDYQSCGTRPLDVQALGLDFYVTGALKYLLGASGVAFLYVQPGLIGSLLPTLTGWFAQEDPFAFDIRHHSPAATAARFQSGTPPIPSIYTALAGIRMIRELGLDRIETRIGALTRRFVEGALDRGWTLKTPLDTKGPLVVVAARDAGTAASLVGRLAHEGIILSSRDNGIRVSFHAYNSNGDVDAVLDALDGKPGI